MKRVLLSVVSLISLTCCGGQTMHVAKHTEFKKSDQLRFLYEVTYNDYSWKDVSSWLDSDVKNNEGSGFGCSSVHYFNYYGRSFDFCYTDMCEFLIRTNNENGHYASIGMAIGDCAINEERVKAINSGSKDEKDLLNEKILPFTMVDGINENGVVCNTNVVPAKDLTPREGESKYYTTGTNPGKEDLFYQFIPRFILDNAKSADHAVELLLNRNITAANSRKEQRDYIGVSKMGYELHCMIADKDKTYIIEFMDNRVSVIASDVMTNFYLSALTPSGVGFERYQILYQNYEKVNSIDDMKSLIKEVQYSQAYRTDFAGQTRPIWPTEFAGVKVDPVLDPLTFYNAEEWSQQHWLEIKDKLQQAYEITQKEETRAKATGETVPWISTHAEAYDIKNRTLHLCTQEEYSKWTEFKL